MQLIIEPDHTLALFVILIKKLLAIWGECSDNRSNTEVINLQQFFIMQDELVGGCWIVTSRLNPPIIRTRRTQVIILK